MSKKQEAPKLYKIQRTVISYCAIPDLYTRNSFLDQHSNDCYVEHRVSRESERNLDEEYVLDKWIVETYPELEGQTILIHIDY